ncbi:hypothetical protein TNCV_3468181 [Trichonephila clavipes]|nr:hypothetical protein TNCV_3468181 [Trichonephila clavipes]
MEISSEQHFQGIPGKSNNVHFWEFWWTEEVSKFRRVLMEPLFSNSGRVGCHIVLLKFPKSVGMYNGHEWVQVIRRDAHMAVTYQSRI